MTREEAKEIIEIIDKVYCTLDKKERQALAVAIQALEQESILDKIRAEIKEMTPTYHNSDWSITDLVPMSKVIDIFDKYKVESEAKN